ncbi:MAG: hypothetical protein E7340_05665 [Clostridiales bacterium]|nr:hypothetical protein [Clostridiales bacterium]MBE5754797.1 hypothetical protein [Clostridiales bacterium]
MTKRIRNLFVAILSCLLVAVACVGMVSLVKADVTVITMTGTAEANVKTAEKSGLRFSAVINKSEYQTLTQDKDAKVGMIIVPTDHLNAAISQGLDFTIEELSTYAPFEGYAFYDYAETVKDNGDEYQFWMTVPNISGANYNRDFSARAFIEINEGNSVSRVYADYDAENARNVYEVAYSAYTDGTIEDQTGKEIAKTFIDGVAVLEYDSNSGKVVIANNQGDYTSPYTIEKDGLGNYIINGRGVNPSAMTYGLERKTSFTFTDTTNSATVNTILTQEAKFGENNSVSLQSAQVNGNSTKANLQAVSDYIGYVAFNGSYDVGTYVTTTFKGNNMPQVMFFSNVIDGDLTGVAYDDETRQGVVAMNGVVGYGGANHATNLYKVIGPNRMSVSNYTSEYYINLNILNGDSYPLLTQDGLNVDTSDVTYRYTVGTYLNDSNAIIWEVFLYNNDTDALIYHEELALRNTAAGYNPLMSDDITASNIVIYSCLKGTKDLYDTDFTYSMPFSRDILLEDIKHSGATINDRCDTVTLTGISVTNGQIGTWKAVKNNYIGFDSLYGLGTYIDFYYTGDNVPYVTFFADQIDGCMNAYDSTGSNSIDGFNRAGIMIASGGRTYTTPGSGSQATANTENNLYFYGPYRYHYTSSYYTKYDVANYTSVENSNFTEILHNNAVDNKQYKLTYGMIDVDGSIYADIALSYLKENETEYTPICSLKLDTGVTVEEMKTALDITEGDLVGKIIVYAAVKGAGNDTTFRFSQPYTKTNG